MATFDDGTLFRSVIEDMVMGLNFRGSVADMVTRKMDQKSQTGKIPVNETVDTLSRDLGTVAVGSEGGPARHGQAGQRRLRHAAAFL